MSIKPIHNEADYEAALKMLEKVFDAEPGTKAGDRAEILTLLIEDYEKRAHAIDAPDPIDMIEFYMKQNDLTPARLGEVIGSRSHATDVLKRRRALSLEMVRAIHGAWNLSPGVLIRPCKGVPAKRYAKAMPGKKKAGAKRSA